MDGAGFFFYFEITNEALKKKNNLALSSYLITSYVLPASLTLWHAQPLLGNDSVNTSPHQRIRRELWDKFRCYVTPRKYKNRGSCAFYVVRTYPLLDNWCVSYGSASELCISGTEQNHISHSTRMRMERVLGRQGRRNQLRIYCELLLLIPPLCSSGQSSWLQI
jgi:hypothetical protein